MAGESYEVQLARLEERVHAQQVDIDTSKAAREEYIPRIQAIESGLGSLAISISNLDITVKALELTIHKMDERLKIPEQQVADIWKERARVLKYVSGILSAIIIAVAVYWITDSIKRHQDDPTVTITTTTPTTTLTPTATSTIPQPKPPSTSIPKQGTQP